MTKLITSVIEFFHKPFRKIIPIQTFTYAAIGGGNTLLDIILYFIIYNFVLQKQVIDLGFITISSHVSALLIGTPVSVFIGFLLHKFITFRLSEKSGKVQLFRYCTVVAGAIILNLGCLKLFVDALNIWPTIARTLAVPIVVAFSYLSNSKYTFKTNK